VPAPRRDPAARPTAPPAATPESPDPRDLTAFAPAKQAALTGEELDDVRRRTAIRPHVVHETIRLEGEMELERSTAALAWSGLAAGLSMGFSFLAVALLRDHLPEQPWRPLVAQLGYAVGFLIVVLGRQQLFTENTLTVVLPLLARRDRRTLTGVLRLWAVVLATNLIGAFGFAWAVHSGGFFGRRIQQTFSTVAAEALAADPATLVVGGVFAGWLIALMVWLLPAAESARIWIILVLTYLIGLAHFPHIIAGSVEVLYAVVEGSVSPAGYLAGWMLPTLVGNTIGGVALVSALNHAQVFAGESKG
jgi:formate/nitrite transporter FocA (FNT family)